MASANSFPQTTNSFRFILFCSYGILSQANYYIPYKEEQHAMWEEFKHSFDPELLRLTVQDDERRFENFVGNLKLIDARNNQEDEPVHGITKFSSLSQVEFEKHYLLDAFPEPSSHLAQVIDSPKFTPGLAKAGYSTPAGDGAISKDWSGELTTPVRDQGECASGYCMRNEGYGVYIPLISHFKTNFLATTIPTHQPIIQPNICFEYPNNLRLYSSQY
jgi:hypothetical protein